MIYLDYAATTPIREEALEMYTAVSKQYFGNASSLHQAGSNAKQVREAAKARIASALNARPRDIHFTSGASESNFLAIMALLDGAENKGKHILCGSIEHASVFDVFHKLKDQGYDFETIPVNGEGIVEPRVVRSLLRPDTVLVSVQHINSEIGSIQPISEIGQILKEHDVLFHTDAVQSFGKLPVDVQKMNVDAVSISSHKIYGPKGIGAVWMHPKATWKPYFDSGDGKKSFRTGTDNIPAMAAFATAVQHAEQNWKTEYEKMQVFRAAFIERIKKLPFECVIEGAETNQSPYILGARFPGMEGQFLMLECDQAGLAISTGSACQVGSDKPNRTMKALGRSDEEARQFVRFSFGKDVKTDFLNEIIDKIDTILSRHFSKVHRPKTGISELN